MLLRQHFGNQMTSDLRKSKVINFVCYTHGISQLSFIVSFLLAKITTLNQFTISGLFAIVGLLGLFLS